MPETRQPRYAPRELSDEAIAWIVRLNSGDSGEEERGAFTQWRGQSGAHEQAAREAEALWDDASDLHCNPRSGFIQPGRKRSGPSRRAVLGGLTGLACAGAGAWTFARTRAPLGDHMTGLGETRSIELADGSRATLNAMTAIDVDYAVDHRRVSLLGGQAYFEVGADLSRPFSVRTGHIEVQALGTAFDVDMSLPDRDIAVAVTEHQVRVTSDRASLLLSEGERAVIARDGSLKSREPQAAATTTAWRTGRYIAEERRLDEVLAALSAYHPGWIVANGEAVKALRVNAVLDLRQPAASLEALAVGLPIQVLRASKYLTIITSA
ncbi:FecR family protein [Nitratireductor pacificus]|uniref:FecR protein n=1 Tax=Nitratireductor pacificus pht-3B TaxID=391937 RepID=K2M975_9HYPH|nr:FecR domain-containing protein [Nitratireductor pacificus]EKF17580.1 FecR protein [Nitratireductor pacificus pht-3B]